MIKKFFRIREQSRSSIDNVPDSFFAPGCVVSSFRARAKGLENVKYKKKLCFTLFTSIKWLTSLEWIMGWQCWVLARLFRVDSTSGTSVLHIFMVPLMPWQGLFVCHQLPPHRIACWMGEDDGWRVCRAFPAQDEEICAKREWNGENLRNLFRFILMNFEHDTKKCVRLLCDGKTRRSASCNYTYRRLS